MTTGTCSRCGQRGQVEYGPDGLSYCQSCSFFGLNKQCWRCRMYLPASELQDYKGQWACPYCIQDMRDADRKASERASSKPKLETYAIPERCDRCGRDLGDRVYIWNGRKLCKPCLDEGQEKWGLVGGGPMASPYKVTLRPAKRRRDESILEALIGTVLHLIGIKKKEKEIIIVEAKMPISRARPMSEAAMNPKDKEKPRPQAEGIMGKASAGVKKAVPKRRKSASRKKPDKKQ